MNAMTLPQLAETLPPARTRSGRGGLSKRYTHLNTLDVARELYKAGYQAIGTSSVTTKKKKDQKFARHLIRFQHQEDELQMGSVPQLIIYNSHDGNAAFRGLAGVFRFACANGLIVGQTDQEVRFVHGGEVTAQVVAEKLIEMVEPTIDRIIAFKDSGSPLELRKEFADRVARFAFPEALDASPELLDDVAFQLLRPRRFADMEPDAWTSLNIVQENLTRGGIKLGEGPVRRQVTREVRGVERTVEWNRFTWDAAADIFLGESQAEPVGRVVSL